MATQKKHFYIATILNPKNDKECDFLPNGMIVTEKSKIVDILPLLKASRLFIQAKNFSTCKS